MRWRKPCWGWIALFLRVGFSIDRFFRSGPRSVGTRLREDPRPLGFFVKAIAGRAHLDQRKHHPHAIAMARHARWCFCAYCENDASLSSLARAATHPLRVPPLPSNRHPYLSSPPPTRLPRTQDYIGVKAKHAVYVPHTAGRYAAKRFRKAQCPIVERLVNALMMHGRNNGKKLMAVRIVKHTMDIIHLLSDQNPLQVIVDAIINSGPREDATRVGSAGVIRRQAVDMSPLRRVNQAIWLITTGSREAAFRNVKTIAECLADELINAAKGSSNSYAIKKKDELERVAKANR